MAKEGAHAMARVPPQGAKPSDPNDGEPAAPIGPTEPPVESKVVSQERQAAANEASDTLTSAPGARPLGLPSTGAASGQARESGWRWAALALAGGGALLAALNLRRWRSATP